MKMKKLLLTLLTVLAPVLASAQPSGSGVMVPLAIDYDLDSVTFVYPSFTADLGANTHVVRAADYPGIPVATKIQTSGASASITATVVGSGPFTAVAIGDQITVTAVGNRTPDLVNAIEGGQTVTLVVLTRADADNITVNQTIDLTGGVSFHYKKFQSTGQAGRGWFSVRPWPVTRFSISVAALTTDTAGMNWRVECRHDIPGFDQGSQIVAYPLEAAYDGTAKLPTCNGSAAFNAADQSCIISDADVAAGIGGNTALVSTAGFFECRVGVRINTADDGADAVIESIRVTAIGYPTK